MSRNNLAAISLAALALQGCGGGEAPAASHNALALVGATTSSSTPTPAPAAMPAPTPTPTFTPSNSGTAVKQTVALPPLDLSDMRLWHYSGDWHASQWNNSFGAFEWKYDHVVKQVDGSVDFVMDMFGAPELQGQTGQGYYDTGTWEVDVTLPEMRDGVVVAPLWLWNHNTKEEIDIEFVGRNGLDITIHAYPSGKNQKSTQRFFSGEDWSGRRVVFAISIDVAAGWAEIFVDGRMLRRLKRDELGYFVTKKFKPVMSMWAAAPGHAGLASWLGQWQGIAPGDKLVMKVHGYRYTPL